MKLLNIIFGALALPTALGYYMSDLYARSDDYLDDNSIAIFAREAFDEYQYWNSLLPRSKSPDWSKNSLADLLDNNHKNPPPKDEKMQFAGFGGKKERKDSLDFLKEESGSDSKGKKKKSGKR